MKEEKGRGGGSRMVDHEEKGGGWWMRFGVGGDLSKWYRPFHQWQVATEI